MPVQDPVQHHMSLKGLLGIQCVQIIHLLLSKQLVPHFRGMLQCTQDLEVEIVYFGKRRDLRDHIYMQGVLPALNLLISM